MDGAEQIKAQPAVEFLTVYSWTILAVILFAVFALALASAQSKQIYPPSHCYITTTLPCYSMFVMSNSIGSVALVIFTNNLGVQIGFPSNAFSISPTYANTIYYGQCLPSNALQGDVVSCYAELGSYMPALGAEINPNFEVSYRICASSCPSSLPVYNTSGTSQLTVSPYVQNFRNFVELASPSSFGNVLPGNETLNFGSTITISASALPGHTFVGWSCTGVGCYSGTSPTNTITLSNYIVETANFK